MRILDRYLIKEMLLTWGAVTVVLLVIMIGNVLARTLSRVTDGSIAADYLVALVGLKSVGILVTLIPLSLYLGILLAHGRFYRDNEMTVMQACGVSWLDIVRPTAIIGMIGALIIALLTSFASPWAARSEQQLLVDMRERSALSALLPGRFVVSRDGSTVLFVEETSADKTQFNSVFMYRQREDELPVVDNARIVSYQSDRLTGDEYLIFTDGQTAIGVPGQSEYIVTDFKRQGVLRPKSARAAPNLRTKAKSVTQLLEENGSPEKAELQWRLSIPLAAFLLALLAVPLSYTSPRQGRFGKIAIAILIYIPYANLLVLARKWIAADVLPSWVGLWPVHLVTLTLVLVLLAHRHGWGWSMGKYRSETTLLNRSATGTA